MARAHVLGSQYPGQRSNKQYHHSQFRHGKRIVPISAKSGESRDKASCRARLAETMFCYKQDLDKIVETIEKHCKDVFEETASEMSFEVSWFALP